MSLAVFKTMVELYGLYLRQKALRSKAQKDSKDLDTSSEELTVNSDSSLGAIKGQEKTAKIYLDGLSFVCVYTFWEHS